MSQPDFPYSPEKTLRYRERKAKGQLRIGHPIELANATVEEFVRVLGAKPIELKDVPVDVEYDDATLTYWDGEKFRDFKDWPPYTVVTPPADPLAGAKIVHALLETAGHTGDPEWRVMVTLRKMGGRWLMWAGAWPSDPKEKRPRPTRRKDFASPFAEHSRQTAELWYGTPVDGWHAGPPPGTPQRKPAQRSTRP